MNRACLECQKRKTKCREAADGSGACSYCTKTRKSCVFEAPAPRTPLTRRNLDAVEMRCQRLEALVRSLDPDLDIEAALKGRMISSETSGQLPEQRAESRPVSPTPADEYEWHESVSQTDERSPSGDGGVVWDGMASLTSRASGYLGSSSGSNLLQSISALLPDGGVVESRGLAGGPPSGDSPKSIRTKDSQPNSHHPHPSDAEHLLAASIVDKLIDAYFVFYNTSYPVLHEHTFRERYNRGIQSNANSSWQLIVYMVLAIGHWVSGESDGDSPYYAAARSRFSVQLLESGTLGAVQAFLLMGNYLQKRDQPNTGYNLIGTAHRMAMGLGLHREMPTMKGDTLAGERRRQVFWTLFCFDSGFSITTGRPTTFSDAFVDVRFPRNIDDSHCTLLSTVPNEVAYPTTYSAIIAQAHLAVIANQIYTEFLSVRTSHIELDHDTAADMEEKLAKWRASLPVYFRSDDIPSWFRRPRAIVTWKEQNLRILLWRGSQRHFTSWLGKVDAARKCQFAAIETISAIAEFCRESADNLHLGISWYATYFLFQAVLALDIHYLEKAVVDRLADTEPNGAEPAWGASIQQARGCLEQLGATNRAASRCLAVLDRIHNYFNRATTISAAPEPLVNLDPCHLETSPDSAALNDNWALSADPALHFFLDSPMDHQLFEGIDGFPSTLDQQYFDFAPNLYPRD